jgi:hypothetical protein
MERLRGWLEVDRGVAFPALSFLYDTIDVLELRFGRGAELQAVRQRQQAMRLLVCEQVRILLGGADSTAMMH